MAKSIPTTFQLNNTTTIKLKRVPRRPSITEITQKGLLVEIDFSDLE